MCRNLYTRRNLPGNRLCELLPPEEAPDDVPDVDIFPKAAVAWTHHPGKKSTDAFHSLTSSHGEPLCQLQPQLPQIMEEDEDLQVRRGGLLEGAATSREPQLPYFQDGAALPLSQHPHSAVARFPFDVECAEWFSVSRPN